MSGFHLVLPGVAKAAAANAANAGDNNNGNMNDNRNSNKMYAFAKLDAEGSFSQSVERSLRKAGQIEEGRPNEVLEDKCGLVLLVLDNSMSMNTRDGKVVSLVEVGLGD